MNHLADIFRLAYRMEIQGMTFYSEQKKKVRIPKLKEIFGHLAKMEEGHANFIQAQIANLRADKPLEALPSPEDDDKFRARMSQQEIDPKALENDLGDYSIVRMAYLIEKDFESFYRKSAEKQEGAARDVLIGLADWEKNHADMMENALEAIIERNHLDLGFYPF